MQALQAHLGFVGDGDCDKANDDEGRDERQIWQVGFWWDEGLMKVQTEHVQDIGKD